MNTKLITALRITANAIENKTFYYNWSDPGCCNCGSLFSSLTGKSPEELRSLKPTPTNLKKGDNQSASWTRAMQHSCPITGIPKNELFRQLMGYGLTQQDIVNLEYLRDIYVLKKMNLQDQTVTIPAKTKWFGLVEVEPSKTVVKKRQLDYSNSKDTVEYMRTWADLLTETGSLDAIPVSENSQVASILKASCTSPKTLAVSQQ